MDTVDQILWLYYQEHSHEPVMAIRRNTPSQAVPSSMEKRDQDGSVVFIINQLLQEFSPLLAGSTHGIFADADLS